MSNRVREARIGNALVFVCKTHNSVLALPMKGKEMEAKKLGLPKTIGELKELIKDYPPETGFGFQNQPMQELWEVKKESPISDDGMTGEA